MYYKSSYSQDPKWIKAKFNSKCHECGETISKNEDVFYYPIGKTVYCSKCGEKHSNEFELARQDEDFINSQF